MRIGFSRDRGDRHDDHRGDDGGGDASRGPGRGAIRGAIRGAGRGAGRDDVPRLDPKGRRVGLTARVSLEQARG